MKLSIFVAAVLVVAIDAQAQTSTQKNVTRDFGMLPQGVDNVPPVGVDNAVTQQGSWVSRTADVGTLPSNTPWTDNFLFTMTDNGSFIGSITSFTREIESGLGTNASVVFSPVPFFATQPIRLYDLTTGAAPIQFGIDNNLTTNSLVIGGLLDDHSYRLEFNGLTNGTKGQAWYEVSAYANYTPAVPEPSTYALLALGLGAVGLMRRSRTRRDD